MKYKMNVTEAFGLQPKVVTPVTASLPRLSSIQTYIALWAVPCASGRLQIQRTSPRFPRACSLVLVSPGTSKIPSPHQRSSYLHCIITSRNTPNPLPSVHLCCLMKLLTWLRPDSISTQENHSLHPHFVSDNTATSY